MPKKGWRFAAMVLGHLLMAGLGNGPAFAQSAGDAPRKELTPIRFGTVAGIGTPGVFAAMDQGFFAEKSITVSLQPLAGGPAIISALIGGSIDIGYGDVFAFSAAVHNGQAVRLIAPANSGGNIDPQRAGAPAQALLVQANSDIHSAKDLAGKKIGLGPTPLNRVALKWWLEKNGVDPGSVQIIAIASIPAAMNTLKTGNVDAIMTSDPFVQLAQADFGGRIVGAPFNDLLSDTTIAALFTSEEMARSKPDVVVDFVSAYRKGVAYFLKADQAERARIVEKYGKLNFAKLAETAPDIVNSIRYYNYATGALNVAAAQAWLDTGSRFREVPSIRLADYLFKTATTSD